MNKTIFAFQAMVCVSGAAVPHPAGAQSTDGLAPCVVRLRGELSQHAEVRAETFDTYTRQATDLRPVIEAATRSQPEFRLSIWDYVARLADAEREADGREVMLREAKALAAIESRHGVDASTVVAVFGVETDYGRVKGRYPVVDATLSRACLDLGNRERKEHFFAALWLLQEGFVERDAFRGSWAGAFGMTQFMPGTFVRYRDDGDGSGRADIIGSVPDALATTARYLSALGWQPGLPWGWEVKVPPNVAATRNSLQGEHVCLAPNQPMGRCLELARWAALGVTHIDGRPLTGSSAAALLMPAGGDGPAWLITRNFQALWQYNRADAYALAIGLLANAMRGEGPMKAVWPTDDPGLSRAELRELQALLVRRGHTEVVVDGADGPRTRNAVAAEEQALGLVVNGRPGTKVLLRMRAEAAASAQGDAARAASPAKGDPVKSP
jgi:lytic murein transglycosylase